jgi:hypothetical protein
MAAIRSGHGAVALLFYKGRQTRPSEGALTLRWESFRRRLLGQAIADEAAAT